MASISKRDRRLPYRVSYRWDGKLYHEDFATRDVAEVRVGEVEYLVGKGICPRKLETTTPTLADAVENLKVWSKAKGRSRRTLRGDLERLNLLVKAVGNPTIGAISESTLMQHLNTFTNCNTWNTSYHAVKALYKANGVPCPLTCTPRHDVQRVPDILSDDDISKLYAAAGDHDKPLVAFVATLGCRIGEACNLKWEDYHGDRVVIRAPKERWDKVLPLPKVLSNMLDAMPRLSEYVFANRRGEKRGDEVTKLIKRISIRAGLGDKVHWHLLRHSAATRLVLQAPLPVVSALLGHRQLSTTQRYLHVAGHHLRAVADGALAEFANRL